MLRVILNVSCYWCTILRILEPQKVLIISLPVHWWSDKSTWITATVFENRFMNCHCMEVEQYCCESNITLKAELMLDNAVGHPMYLIHLYQSVSVMFLLPKAFLIQPLYQDIKATYNVLSAVDILPATGWYWQSWKANSLWILALTTSSLQ